MNHGLNSRRTVIPLHSRHRTCFSWSLALFRHGTPSISWPHLPQVPVARTSAEDASLSLLVISEHPRGEERVGP